MRLRLLLSLTGVVLVVALLLFGLDILGFVNSPMPVGRPVLYVVPPGRSFSAVAEDLAAKGLVGRPRYLIWLARLQGLDERIQAGEYRLTPGTTQLQFLDALVHGRVIHHSFTLVEGWTFRQLLAALRGADYLEHTLDGLDDGQVMARLGYADVFPEGRFLPDTYFVTRQTKDTALLRRAYQAMRQCLVQEWQQRDPNLPYDTPRQALILASIVEREAALADERARIAGVFVRRLRIGMALQADPTVIYGLGDRFDGNLTRADLEADTPYNTYLHPGLPPTPIAMPGTAALHAALHPERGMMMYFVARGDGSHQFSETLEEHSRAVRRYQRKREPGSP
jgi:peptidoglycan lytic transglycosylase G